MNYKKLVAIGVGLFMLLLSIPSMTPFVGRAAAAPGSSSWLDARHISVDGQTYTYQKTITVATVCGSTGRGGNGACRSEKAAVFVQASPSVSCTINPNTTEKTASGTTYKNSDLNYNGASVVLLSLFTGASTYNGDGTDNVTGGTDFVSFSAPAPGAGDQSCAGSATTITVSNQNNAKVRFEWTDANTITDISNGWVYKNHDPSNANRFYKTPPNAGTCSSYLQTTSSSSGDYYAALDKPKDGYTKQGGCWYKKTGTYTIGDVNNASIPGDANATPVTNTPGCTSTDSNGNCTASNDILNCNSGSADWFICPAITLGAKAANSIDGFIMDNLDVDVGPIFDNTNAAGTPAAGYYTAWNSFRIIAIGILVIGGLIMVTSQALGFEMLDAYTIRKTLPRLLVAIIGISLSWPLMKLAVSFFDTAGIDIRELIYAPFGAWHTTLTNGAGFLSSAAVIALFVAMGPAALTFIITAILAVLVGYLILVIRRVAIIMLIIVAPVAIACYILPGTQKLWKMWWENFLGLMLMFPIISALIAAGHVFSAVALPRPGSSTTPASLASTALAILAYFIVYFLLPMVARMVSGTIGTLAGMVNDHSKGIFDGLKKKRGEAVAHRGQQWRNGELGGELLGRKIYNGLGVNNLGRRVRAGSEGYYGFGVRGKQRLATDAAVAYDQALKENPHLTKFAQGNDAGNAVLALSGGTKQGAQAAARQLFTDASGHYDAEKGEKAIKSAEAMGLSQRNAGAALMGLAQNKSRAVGAGRVDIIRDGIDRLAGGNAELAEELGGTFAYYSRGVGRVDLGGTNWIGTGEDRQNFARSTDKLASRYAVAGGRTAVSGTDRAQAQADVAMLDGIKRTKVPDLVGGTGAAMQQAADTAVRMYQLGDPDMQQRAATHLLEFQQNLSGATDENARIINQALQRAGVSYAPGPDGTSPSVADQLAGGIGVDSITLTRGARTYGADVPIGARGAVPPAAPPPGSGGDEP